MSAPAAKTVVSPLRSFARYGGLGAGIIYGFFHHRGLNKSKAAQELEAREKRHIERVAEARAQWQIRQAALAPKTGVISNPDDPNFDLEAFLVHLDKTQK
ncbi:hypothetical protein BJ684DRAFT_20318 [Piptocephalis cylindrospora]|uniref:ATP synthase F(0) complex subunit e, mitochondrial n=1 Tax=Piptocephalis cylindrospora TaxID=1907219 RepID=A0A4P9Y2V1_9FUNG|nr:hypothetical protein BJ684DRAFT_20318 [Piptocephalis cylindrospora]|eukprot:RKP13175.1 hypothetical protein BJ684DRAFT_20318 [Piptocephalis cylindrospora]